MKHTPSCDQANKRVLAERLAYAEKWPNHCKTCEGAGMATYTENQSPIGSGSYWPMESEEPCPDCYEQGICPRCGADNTELWENGDAWAWGDAEPCPTCGWTEGIDGMPEYPECDCWLVYEEGDGE